ncbi:MAG: nucleotidyltransferase family protein [Nitrospina sp.]|jgi:mannose-1-phosphate guanylyltransferase|nr:nucleotidyltransferase family protein [Nitrospina sp.]
MRALLLAAGLGTRLRPITNTIPKCLVEINGKPLLDYWIELLNKGGIYEILLNLHYLPDVVRSHVENSDYPAEITIAYEENLLGTGGTLLKNREYFQDEPLMLIHADNLSIFDIKAFEKCYERRKKNVEITMMTFNTPDPEACGIVEVDDHGIVIAFHEKVKDPPGNLANGAVYILSPSIWDFLVSLRKEQIDFSTEVLPHFMRRINTYQNEIYHRDIGTMESLQTARREFPIAYIKDLPSR